MFDQVQWVNNAPCVKPMLSPHALRVLNSGGSVTKIEKIEWILVLQNGVWIYKTAFFVTAKILSQLDLDVISGGLIVRC